MKTSLQTKQERRSIESRTPSVQMAQAERPNTNISQWTTVQSQVGGWGGDDDDDDDDSLKMVLVLKTFSFSCNT